MLAIVAGDRLIEDAGENIGAPAIKLIEHDTGACAPHMDSEHACTGGRLERDIIGRACPASATSQARRSGVLNC
jgi:hypothetical protein